MKRNRVEYRCAKLAAPQPYSPTRFRSARRGRNHAESFEEECEKSTSPNSTRRKTCSYWSASTVSANSLTR